MSFMVGADVGELRELAEYFRRRAGQLQSIENSLAWRIHSAPWHGSDIAAFKTHWDRSYRGMIQGAVRDLQSSAGFLSAEADQQEEASAGGAGATGFIGGARSALQCRTVESLLPGLQRALASTTANGVAWWNSLSADDRKALIVAFPGLVLQLGFLSAPDRDNALAEFTRQFRAGTVVSSEQNEFDVKGQLRWVELGADGSAEIQKNADGSYRVALSGDVTAGVGLKSPHAGAGVSLTGGVTTVYQFHDRAGAEAFVRDLEKAAVPQNVRDGAVLLAGPAAYIAGKYAGVFDRYKNHYVTTDLSGEVRGEVKVAAGPASASVSGGAKVSYDTTSRETTYSMGYQADGHVAAGGASVGIGTGGGYSFTVDRSGQLTSLQILQTHGSGAGVGLPDGLPASASHSLDRSSTVTIDADLRNPVNQRLAIQYLQDCGRGNFDGASSAAAQLQHNSTVTVSSSSSSSRSFGVDLDVAQVDVSSTSSQVQSLYVKPPGGTFQRVDLRGAAPSRTSGGGGW